MLDLTSFDINAVIKDTAASFEGTCTKKRISISLILASRTLYVCADMGKIQQVLYNLIDNAIKFSNNDSTITVETTEKHGKVFVSVKDTGCGIPKASITKIWERFYKLDASRGKDRKGTGLGLRSSKRSSLRITRISMSSVQRRWYRIYLYTRQRRSTKISPSAEGLFCQTYQTNSGGNFHYEPKHH